MLHSAPRAYTAFITNDQRKALNQELASFFGQLTQHIDKRIDGLQHEVTVRLDAVHTTLDGLASRLDIETAERAALGHQADRHQNWIGQLADSTHTKLIPEL